MRNCGRVVFVQHPGWIKIFIFCRLFDGGKSLYPAVSDVTSGRIESVFTDNVEQQIQSECPGDGG